jgi:hypothetical protein
LRFAPESTHREAKAAPFEYVPIFCSRDRRHFFNRERLRSSIGYRAPEQARLDMISAGAAS